MRKTSIAKDIINSFVSIAKGLWVTLINWSILRPSVTELYPEQKPNLPENYRGLPTLPVDSATGTTRCIACGACERICPEHVIRVVAEKGTDPKDRKPAEFEIDLSRCMWCGLCMEVCPKDCLKPGRTFELACNTREGMIYRLPELMKLGGTLKELESQKVEKSKGSEDDAPNP